MPPGEYTIHLWGFTYELCLFLPVPDTVKYRKSQFYATNHNLHQNAMYLTVQLCNQVMLLNFDSTFLSMMLCQEISATVFMDPLE